MFLVQGRFETEQHFCFNKVCNVSPFYPLFSDVNIIMLSLRL